MLMAIGFLRYTLVNQHKLWFVGFSEVMNFKLGGYNTMNKANQNGSGVIFTVSSCGVMYCSSHFVGIRVNTLVPGTLLQINYGQTTDFLFWSRRESYE